MDWKGIFRVKLGKHGSATIRAFGLSTKRPEVQYISIAAAILNSIIVRAAEYACSANY